MSLHKSIHDGTAACHTDILRATVAANTFVRSGFAGAFPLFITYELKAIGVGWGISVYAIFATCLIPIPFCFVKWGPAIRARGEWSRESTL